MTPGVGGPGLEIEEFPKFQERQFVVQRVGWAVIALVLLAALLGVFGEGPWAHVEKTAEDASLTVAYERVTRHGSPTSLSITVSPDAVADGEAQLFISTEFLDGVQLQQLLPEPDSVEADLRRTLFRFKSVTPGPVEVTIDLQHNGKWTVPLEIGIVGRPSIRTRQFVLP